MNAWIRTEPTEVTNVGWRTVVSKTFTLPDGQSAVFGTLGREGQEYAAVIALTPSNKIVIARQYRPGPEKVLDELPGGAIEKGEDPEAAIKRELLEETGYEPSEIKYIGTYIKDAYMNGLWHVFLAKDCIKLSEQNLDDNEIIDVLEISVEELISNAKASKMTDQIAVFMALDEIEKYRG